MFLCDILESEVFLWSDQDKHHFLEIRKTGTEVYYRGGVLEPTELEEGEVEPKLYIPAMVRADRPITRHGQFYFEVLIVSSGKGKEIGVGICIKNSSLNKMPGWDPFTFGYHGDDGKIYCEDDSSRKAMKGEKFESGDQIGVLLDFNTAELTFSKNKKNIKMIKLEAHHMNQDFYPSIGIISSDAIVQLKSGGKLMIF